MKYKCLTTYFLLPITISIICYSKILSAEKNAFLLQPDVYTILTETHEEMGKGNFEHAEKKLQPLIQSNKLKDYDKAIVYQTMGYIKNELGKFEAAAKNFEESLSFNHLPNEVTHELHYTTAQLLIHIGEADKGLNYLSMWFENEKTPKADAYILAASAFYQTKNYQQLILHIEKALSLSKKPSLNWYELLLAAYYETKEYKKAADTLKSIISLYPDKTDYWIQLTTIYQQLGQTKRALTIYELAYAKKILKENEIIQLIKTYLYLEMPYKAGMVLEQELTIGNVKNTRKTLMLLVDCWLLAREKKRAESVLKRLIKQFNEDEAYLKLAQLYIESEQWQETIELLNIKRQFKNKKLKSNLSLLLGIAQYHIKNKDKAIRRFKQALSDETTAEQAKWWLDHLKKETRQSDQTSNAFQLNIDRTDNHERCPCSIILYSV